jgi:colanic acid biosynthesis glycosyl transferase WcaI
LKIGLLSQWYAPEPGAAAVPTVLARALATRGHEVSVLTGLPNYPTGRLYPGYRMRPVIDETGEGGVHIRRVALYPSHDGSGWRRGLNYGSFAASASLGGLGALRGVDAFWVYNSPATVGVPSALASAVWGAPHLLHVMDLWPDSIGFSGMAGERAYRVMEAALRRWCQTTYRLAGAVACISPGVVEVLAERGVPRHKLHYVPVWADEAVYHPRAPDEDLARELGVTGCLTLLYAGNLGHAQGLDTLLEACARLGDLARFRCLIAGSGTDEARLREQADGLGLTNVRFLGRWPGEDMGRLVSVADMALVSLSDDPLSAITMPSKLPALLAAGISVVACAVGDVADIVTASGAGWTVRPGDVEGLEQAIRRAHAEGGGALADRGRMARAYYERHLSLGRGVDAVEAILERISQDRAAHAS